MLILYKCMILSLYQFAQEGGWSREAMLDVMEE